MSKRIRSAVFVASLAIVAAACSSDETTSTDTGGDATTTTAASGETMPPDTAGGGTDYQWTPNETLLAGAEGQVNLVAWAGYAEDG